ncbi:hypothetical protein IMCC3317_27560 [Kordia antarctica]|uniref:Uncharacterized protein n=1 Tax=Kordia antarctica TaxID=1218801 RepID=A0A7L4ZLK8_9FLAO|nr:hypothetical protein [Kordia antarctica]QHI37377.1 hypothetical protein IMCC3317_27560 [Kordia antarctica]
MKTVRNLFRFLCILTLVVSLTNCQHDTVSETQQDEALQKEFPFKSSILSKQDVEANTKLSNQMRSLTTLQSSNLAESVYNETYNFTIDTDVVKFVESTENDLHSYTFPISRENNTSSALENLVFSYNATTDNYEASLVTYHFTASQQQEFLLTQHVRTPYEISYESIAVNLSDIVGETSLPCTTNYTEYHTTPDTGETFVHSSSIGNVNNECEHEDTSGNTSCTVYTIITTDCPVSGSTSGSPSSPSNSPTGGGNTTPNNDNDNDDRVITSPILSPSQIITDCMNGDSFNPLLSEEALNWLQENRSSSAAMSNYLKNVGCDESAQNFVEEAIEEMMANPNLTFEEYIEQQVEDILEANPFALLEIDCNQIDHWQTLAQHIPPQTVKDKIEGLHANHEAALGDWQIQSLEEAGGKVLNLDYFAVKVTTLPNNPVTGTQFNAQDFLVYFRKNINNFTNGSTFEPYCEIPSICQQETNLWNTTNILGAIVKLDIPAYNGVGGDTFGNDGVVVCSEFTNNYWNFMTMEAPYDYSHPVSGTRQFGFETNSDGSYNFYVRGVDRFNSRAQEIAAGIVFGDDIFSKADELWETVQEKLSIFINANGGGSTIVTPVTNRANWEKVKDVLQGKRPTSDLGCN